MELFSISQQVGQQAPQVELPPGFSLEDINIDDWAVQQASIMVEELDALSRGKVTPKKAGGATPKKRKWAGKSPVKTSKKRIRLQKSRKLQKAPKGTVYPCEECGDVFKMQKDLIAHFTIHSSNKPFKCTRCDRRFRTNHDRHRHTLFVHLNKLPFHCRYCNKGFRIREYLETHENGHLKSEDRPYKCKYCGKTFRGSRYWAFHVKSHLEDTRVKCDLCPAKYFCVSVHYKKHLRVAHKALVSADSKKCLICDKEFFKRPILMQHMRDNHSDIGVKCDVCGVTQADKDSLEQHKKRVCKGINRDERKEAAKLNRIRQNAPQISFSMGEEIEQVFMLCTLCGGLFSNDATLEQHMAVHKDTKAALTKEEVSSIQSSQQEVARIRGRSQKLDVQEITTPLGFQMNRERQKRGKRCQKLQAASVQQAAATEEQVAAPVKENVDTRPDVINLDDEADQFLTPLQKMQKAIKRIKELEAKKLK